MSNHPTLAKAATLVDAEDRALAQTARNEKPVGIPRESIHTLSPRCAALVRSPDQGYVVDWPNTVDAACGACYGKDPRFWIFG